MPVLVSCVFCDYLCLYYLKLMIVLINGFFFKVNLNICGKCNQWISLVRYKKSFCLTSSNSLSELWFYIVGKKIIHLFKFCENFNLDPFIELFSKQICKLYQLYIEIKIMMLRMLSNYENNWVWDI